MIPLETFFRIKPKVELNFTLTPIWGRSRLILETKPSSSDGSGVNTITDDWNELLNKRASISGRLILSEFTKTQLKKYK